MIEFAVVLPVFVFLLIGVIEFGRYTYFAILASHAARAGVQYAAQNLETAADANANGPGTASAAKADAQSLSGWKVTSAVVCTVNSQPSPCPASNAIVSNVVYYVQVSVSATFNSLMKYPGIPQQLPVSATAMMRVANQ